MSGFHQAGQISLRDLTWLEISSKERLPHFAFSFPGETQNSFLPKPRHWLDKGPSTLELELPDKIRLPS